MAVREKTIEYGFPTYGPSVASGTRYDFSAITLYIPETTSRVFRSVIIEVYAEDNVTTAASITANLVGIKLGSTSFTDTSNTVTITNSGEQCSWMVQTDVTAYFTSNFGSGSSQTCQVGCSFTGAAATNRTAKIIITYEYEEQDTQVKTVRIPLESGTGALTTSLVEIGTNQVPALDTFLPETSKTYRCIWFEIEGNDANNGTTDYYLQYALTSESAASTNGNIEAGLNSARWFRYNWVRNDLNTSAASGFRLATFNIAGGTFDHLSITLCVTYEYSSTSSTTILNSLALPFRVNPGSTSGSSSADKDLMDISFYIEEPTTITLVQSGIKLHWLNDAASNLSIMCGSQSARTYNDSARAFCGGIACTHRIDSGAAQGAGITLARGKNTFLCYVYSSVANVRHNGLTGVLYLNYTSGKHTGGVDVHNHTLIYSVHNKNANLYLVQAAAASPYIPETNYYVNHMGIRIVTNKDQTTCLLGNAGMTCEWMTGEEYSEGTQDLGAVLGLSDAEQGVCMFHRDVSDFFYRWPLDTNAVRDRMPLEVSRNWFLSVSKQVCSSQLYITYHAATYNVAGTITGTGGGTVTWKVHKDSDGTIIGNGTGTSPSIIWYDNTEDLYIEAYEDATHVGRSAKGTAT
jgi:hypothetical protein